MVMGVLLTLIIAISPILASGYYGDDAINSIERGIRLFNGASLFDFTSYYFYSWIDTQGRFFPFAWYLYWVFDVFDSLLLYKAVSVISVVLSCSFFGYFIYRLSGDKYKALLSILSLSFIFQLRVFHDPMLSFQCLLQVVLIEIMLSSIVLLNYLDGGTKYWLPLSWLLYLISLWTYEITYTFFLIFFFVSLFRVRKLIKAVLISVPYMLLALGCMVFSMWLRSKASGILPAYQINFNVFIYLKAYLTQVTSGIPLIYYIANPAHISVFNPLTVLVRAGVLGGLGSVLCLYISYVLLNKLDFASNFRSGLYVGLPLILLPGAMTSLSPKHQGMHFGNGYLPVFLQYFGFAALVVYWILRQRNMASLKGGWGKNSFRLSMAFSLMFLLNFQNNRTVVNSFNKKSLYPRHVLENALRAGLVNSAPENSVILVDSANVWDNRYFVYQWTGRKYFVESKSEIKSYASAHNLSKTRMPMHIYLLRYSSDSLAHGYVLFGRLVEGQIPQMATGLNFVDSLSVYSDGLPQKCLAITHSNFSNKKSVIDFSGLKYSKDTDGFYSAIIPLNGRAVEFNALTIMQSPCGTAVGGKTGDLQN